MQNYDSAEWINIGSGEEYTIKELSEIIKDAVGYSGKIIWDVEKPNGTPRRKLSTERLESLGWAASINLKDGLRRTIDWYLESDLNE